MQEEYLQSQLYNIRPIHSIHGRDMLYPELSSILPLIEAQPCHERSDLVQARNPSSKGKQVAKTIIIQITTTSARTLSDAFRHLQVR